MLKPFRFKIANKPQLSGEFHVKVKQNAQPLKGKQTGIVLVTALLLLLIFSILAVTAFKTSFMQTLIANNFQFQKKSFQTAENLLKFAENIIEEKIDDSSYFDFNLPNDGFYPQDVDIDYSTLDWENLVDVEVGPNPGDKFIIQFTGRQTVPGSDESAQGAPGAVAGSYVYTFIVTARSVSSKRAEKVLQSIYVTSDQI